MLLDFSAMEETVIPNFMDGEGEVHAKMQADGLNRILDFFF